MKTKCLIVDDEPIAIDVIKSHLNHFNDFEIVAECENAVEAMEVINKQKVDLVFLDIQMPQINGIDFLKSIKVDFKVIITTAFRDYAIEGYQLDVIDYLLKPISFERFMKAINKYYQHKQDDIIVFKKETGLDSNLFIYAKEGKETHKIYLKDILFIESYKDQIRINLTDRSIELRYKISDFESKLPDDYFIRTHKSFIISIGKITSFSSSGIKIGNTEIPIGRTYFEQVKRKLESD